MPTTPRGLIYPDSSAHTRTWEHWQALAESADAAIGNAAPPGANARAASGIAAVVISALNTVVLTTVTYPVGRFTAVPSVTLAHTNGTNPHFMDIGLTAPIGVDSFAIGVRRNGGSGNVFVHWIARQEA